MATLSLSGDPKPKKKGAPVDACSDGKCPPNRMTKLSISNAFNPNKSRYGISQGKPDKPSKREIPEGGLHMNMRDLSGEPGDTKLAVDNNKTALSPEQESVGVKLNFKTRKEKKGLKIYK